MCKSPLFPSNNQNIISLVFWMQLMPKPQNMLKAESQKRDKAVVPAARD